MRIVLDTNVVLSALLWRGTPYRLLETIRRHEHVQLFASVALLQELGEVLMRPIPQQRLVLLNRAAHELLSDYVDAIELVTPLATPPVVAADADDDLVIAAAVAAEADLLVSGDRHLLTLKSHRGIRIVTPGGRNAAYRGKLISPPPAFITTTRRDWAGDGDGEERCTDPGR